MKIDFEVAYRRIGLLFCGVARSQRTWTIERYDRLVSIIKTRWPVIDGTPNHQLSNELHRIMLNAVRDGYAQSMSAEEALLLFRVYFSVHAKAFEKALVKRILATSREIADAFSGDGLLHPSYREVEALLEDYTLRDAA